MESTIAANDGDDAGARQRLLREFHAALQRFRELSRQIRELADKAREAGAPEAQSLAETAGRITRDLWGDFHEPTAHGRTLFGDCMDRVLSRDELEAEMEGHSPNVRSDKIPALQSIEAEIRQLTEQMRLLMATVAKLESEGAPKARNDWDEAKEIAKRHGRPDIVGTLENWSFNRPPSGNVSGQFNASDVISGRIVGMGFDEKSGMPYVTDEAGHSFLLSENYGGAWNPVEEMDSIQSGIIVNQSAIARGEKPPFANPCPYVPPEGKEVIAEMQRERLSSRKTPLGERPSENPDDGLTPEEVASVDDDEGGESHRM